MRHELVSLYVRLPSWAVDPHRLGPLTSTSPNYALTRPSALQATTQFTSRVGISDAPPLWSPAAAQRADIPLPRYPPPRHFPCLYRRPGVATSRPAV